MLSSGCYRDALHAGHKAATLYAMSSDSFRSSKSARCGLHLSVGRFQRWLIDAGTAPYVQEGAAIYAAACIESILDDIVLVCLQQGAFRYVREGKCWERDNRRRRRQRGRSRRRRERGRVGVVDLPILQWRSHGRTGGQQPPPLSSPWLRHCPQGTSTTGSWYVWPCYINVALVSNKPIFVFM